MDSETESGKARLGKKKREHSVPVYYIYKESEKILKKVQEGEGLRELIYNSKLRNPRAVYALVANSIKNNTFLDNVLEITGLQNENFDNDLAKILVTELLFGKKTLVGESRPVQTTLAYHSKLKKAVDKAGIAVSITTALKPRFARVNSLLTNVETTVNYLISDGWESVDTPDSYDDFRELIFNLNEYQFVQDYHFNDVLVFPSKAELYNYQLVENGSLILEDKASCLPAHLLNPLPGSVVLDMCAAPGIKTIHMANVMNNEGTIYAVDMKENRFQTMEKLIQRYCGKQSCVTMKLADSTRLTSEECPGVKYILVDPSCSGTGMNDRIDDSRHKLAKCNSSRRIEKLANFQEHLLVHALTAFPDVERVVYSTCSILEEENEQVVERALARVPEFNVVSPELPVPWQHRGDSKYPFGSDCVKADLEKDGCNGFFVIVLERTEYARIKVKGGKRKSGVVKAETVKTPRKRGQIKKKKEMN